MKKFFVCVAFALVWQIQFSMFSKTEKLSFRQRQPEVENFVKIDTLNLVIGKIDYKSLKIFTWVTDIQYVSKSMFLDTEAFNGFKKMQIAAKKEKINIKIISGVRSFKDQKAIWEGKWTGKKGNHYLIKNEKERALDILKFSSMPMTSRHHWGTDIDLNSLDNAYFLKGEGKKLYAWLTKNASTYGFYQVYSNKIVTKRTGYEEEKWHWSYLPKAKKYLAFYNKNISDKEIEGFKGSEQAEKVEMVKNYVNGIIQYKK